MKLFAWAIIVVSLFSLGWLLVETANNNRLDAAIAARDAAIYPLTSEELDESVDTLVDPDKPYLWDGTQQAHADRDEHGWTPDEAAEALERDKAHVVEEFLLQSERDLKRAEEETAALHCANHGILTVTRDPDGKLISVECRP